MKITAIRVYKTPLPYVDGIYKWGAGNAIEIAQASVVEIETDAGLIGVGEFTPCGENYIEGYSEGVEAAARMLAPQLIGQDPRQVYAIERIMDNTILGHAYAKSPFDNACWDILGQATGQPLWMLLGGKLTDGAPMYRVAPQAAPDEMKVQMERLRDRGYSQFQIKVGADYIRDIERIQQTVPFLKQGEKAFADANQGWTVDQALSVAKATKDLDFILEQPCKTYEECQQVRRRIDHILKLDECITDMRMVHRVIEDRGAEIICLKISKQGGLSKAKRMRDVLVDHRFKVVAEDTWGGEIVSAAVAHFAASTPPEFLVNATDLHLYNTRSTGKPGPLTKKGKIFAPDTPGLGVKPDYDSLGAPVFEMKSS